MPASVHASPANLSYFIFEFERSLRRFRSLRRVVIAVFNISVPMAALTDCGRRARAGDPLVEPVGSPFPVGSSPHSLGVGDFNRDGKLDLAIPNTKDGNVTVLLGNGMGGFAQAPGSPFRAGTGPASIAVGDFNQDGEQDLAIGNFNSGDVTILIGTGKGGFIEALGSPYKMPVLRGSSHPGLSMAVGNFPLHLAVGDFNGDGMLDLVVAEAMEDNLTVLLGNGKGGFRKAPGYSFRTGAIPHSLAVADFNGDGRLDLAVANVGSNNVTVLLGNADSRFSDAPGSPFKIGGFPWSVAVGDFNEDGKPDLSVVDGKNDSVAVLLGDGNGVFTKSSGSPFSVGWWTWPFCVAVTDIDRDGRLDLVVANTNNTVTILLGSGRGLFSKAPDSPYRAGKLPRWVVAEDFDRDGMPDLALANAGSNDVTVLLNRHVGTQFPNGR